MVPAAVVGAGDGDALALAAGEQPASLARPGVIAQREPGDELMGMGHLSRRRHPPHVRLVVAEGDVAGDGVGEHEVAGHPLR